MNKKDYIEYLSKRKNISNAEDIAEELEKTFGKNIEDVTSDDIEYTIDDLRGRINLISMYKSYIKYVSDKEDKYDLDSLEKSYGTYEDDYKEFFNYLDRFMINDKMYEYNRFKFKEIICIAEHFNMVKNLTNVTLDEAINIKNVVIKKESLESQQIYAKMLDFYIEFKKKNNNGEDVKDPLFLKFNLLYKDFIDYLWKIDPLPMNLALNRDAFKKILIYAYNNKLIKTKEYLSNLDANKLLELVNSNDIIIDGINNINLKYVLEYYIDYTRAS